MDAGKDVRTLQIGLQSVRLIRGRGYSLKMAQYAPSAQLPLEDYKRYGRQMIMSEVGLHGQLRLKNARVLVVGCGGLGCPAAAYLAGAGVGTLGLMDGDVVEISNLHRQVAHATSRVGMSKVDSAYEYLSECVGCLNDFQRVLFLI